LKVIQLKEASESLESALKQKAKQAVQEKADLAFLSQQKDLKIQYLDKQVAEMQAKLEKAL
jgi:D-aminopeptidase